MSQRRPADDELDLWLAELDRRLGEIQADLSAAALPGRPSGDLVVSAGPFESTGSLRAFERALADMAGVREVMVREYAGDDRAIIDVRLGDPTS